MACSEGQGSWGEPGFTLRSREHQPDRCYVVRPALLRFVRRGSHKRLPAGSRWSPTSMWEGWPLRADASRSRPIPFR